MARLGVIAVSDPLNIRTWSGTPYFMTRALKERFPDLLPVREPWPFGLEFLRRAVRKSTFGRIDMFWNATLVRTFATRLASRLKAQQVEVAFCIGMAPLSAYLSEHLPTIHVSDATVPLMRDYYAEFWNLPKSLAQSALRLDRTSVLRSRACLYSTEWAARSAVQDYGADPAKVNVIPWGANMERRAASEDDRPTPDGICHLVFIGVDWKRKGGAIAVATAERLAAAGHQVRLHVIGVTPPTRCHSDTIVYHGFINKGTAEGREAFDRIMRQASFLFVPTRQDCSPMVFPEAGAYGLPIITTRTGGVPGIVREGMNGHLLDIEATHEAYAEVIWKVWSDKAGYGQLRRTSRAEYDTVLNWDSWLSAATSIIEDAALDRSSA